MDNDVKQKIAYFKFSLIAPLINENYTQETQKNIWRLLLLKFMMCLH